MKKTQYFRLDSFNFSISGEGSIYEYLIDEFSSLPAGQSTTKSNLEIIFVQSLPRPPEGAIATKSYIGWNNGFQHISGNLNYQVTLNEDTYTIFVVNKNHLNINPIKKWILKFLDWNYLTAEQNLAKNFMYTCFNLISGVIMPQIKLGCYLHASSMEKDGKGIALVASGGIGKTTTMLHLVTNSGWRYLSDDIALLTQQGLLIRTPLRMQVYAYNLMNNKSLQKQFLARRNISDRLSWYIRLQRKGPYKTRRRTSAEELFGSKLVSKHANSAAIFFMEKAFIKNPETKRSSPESIIKKISHVMPQEIGGLNDLSDNLALVGCTLPGFNRDEFLSSQKEILTKAMATIPTYQISIPYEYNNKDLTKYIENTIDDILSSNI